MNPRVRVYIPTFRRPRLLPRAVDSLRRQTCADWVCEIHNDAPGDESPARLISALGDGRIHLRQHERNLGGAATFNLFFRAASEPFCAVLEDDNWWEPNFLEEMLATAQAHPTVTVFWANQRLWQEEIDGSFSNTGRLVREREKSAESQLMPWGQSAQVCGALHSQSATLFRTQPGRDFATPAVPIAAIEMFRERRFDHPLLFVSRPLANFAITRESARDRDRAAWAEVQTMLTATFCQHARFNSAQLSALWSAARGQTPPATTTLLLAGLSEPACRNLLRFARIRDWVRLLRGALRRPAVLWRVLRSRRLHPDWWVFLERHTAERFAAREQEPTATP